MRLKTYSGCSLWVYCGSDCDINSAPEARQTFEFALERENWTSRFGKCSSSHRKFSMSISRAAMGWLDRPLVCASRLGLLNRVRGAMCHLHWAPGSPERKVS